eukprot:2531996-Prymnesium_polylepis.1
MGNAPLSNGTTPGGPRIQHPQLSSLPPGSARSIEERVVKEAGPVISSSGRFRICRIERM